MNENNSVYTEEELNILKKTEEIRLRIVNKMTEKDIPSKTSELRVLNEILNSLDKSVHDKVSNKLKQKENENKSAMLDTVAEALTIITKKQKQQVIQNRTIEVPDSVVPDDIVPGETDINSLPIELEDIVGDKNDN